MRKSMFALVVVGALVVLSACSGSKNPGGSTTSVPEAPSSATTTQAPSNQIAVALGETDPTHMFIHLSGNQGAAGEVTFTVTNEGTRTHEFVVLQADADAGSFPIVSFEGESDRIDEEAPGVVNVGETGDMEPGTTKTLTIDLAPGHYALVCNLKGHYRMGMYQDLQVT
jgi:uncharacterized cupredoxin-like copper-binding protein